MKNPLADFPEAHVSRIFSHSIDIELSLDNPDGNLRRVWIGLSNIGAINISAMGSLSKSSARRLGEALLKITE